MLRKINSNEEKNSCSSAGARTHITSNYTKPRDIRPKHYNHWTIYSATTILEKCRKVVLEKWFCKLGFFFLVNHFSPT